MPFPEQAQQFVLFVGLPRIREASSRLDSLQIVRSNRLISRMLPKKSLRKAPVSSSPPLLAWPGLYFAGVLEQGGCRVPTCIGE